MPSGFRVRIRPALLLLALVLPGRPIRADDFPRGLVEWTPIAGNPVFQGTGGDTWDRKIRERGYVLIQDGRYHLWYTGYNDDRSPTKFLGHATSTDGRQWTRDLANPIFDKTWVE